MEAPNGHNCPDGHPHHWLLGDPSYIEQDGQDIEVTHETCRNCGAEQDNRCPLLLDWVENIGDREVTNASLVRL